MLRKYKFSRINMKNEILEYEIRSDPHKELHLRFPPDLFRHRHVAAGDRRSPAVKEKRNPGGMVGSF